MNDTHSSGVFLASDHYPNEVDLRALDVAHGQLAANGVAPGANGYDLDTLAAATYGKGWSYRIDRSAGALGYQAELHQQSGPTRHALGSAVGWETAVALTFALCNVIEGSKRAATGNGRSVINR
jgi:hypothetical protein